MVNKSFKSKLAILERAHELIGIPLKEIDRTNKLSTGKGAIGSIIEESGFGFRINNESSPDFKDVGVELKTIPFIRTKQGIKAKERLVCNIINYMEEYKHTFESSSFWKKCRTMLLVPYEYKKGIPKGELTIAAAALFNFPDDDLAIIKQDWYKIIEKIKNGKAHEISEGDTTYLGACTKGKNSHTLRKQPFSNIMAKQRAFALKQSYVTYILNNYVFGDTADENIIKNPDDLKIKTFEQYIIDKIRPFIGMSQVSICQQLGIDSTAKNLNELILARILGVKGRISNTKEFKKANIVPKTIRINTDGSITESMSFPAFRFKKIITEKWETSEFKEYLEQTKFLFVIFRYRNDGQLIFEDLMFWHVPEDDLEEIAKVWKRTVEVIKKGVELKTIGKRTYNNLPKSSENPIVHVRPHGRDKSDIDVLPDGRTMPKQCFWLNNTYIKKQIELKKVYGDN